MIQSFPKRWHKYYKHILHGLLQVIVQQQQGRSFGHLGQEHFHLKQLKQEQSGHEHGQSGHEREQSGHEHKQSGKMQQFLLHEHDLFLQQRDGGHEQQWDGGHELQRDGGHEQQHRHFGSEGQLKHGLQLHGPQQEQRGISSLREHPSQQQQQQIDDKLKQGIPLYHKQTYVILQSKALCIID